MFNRADGSVHYRGLSSVDGGWTETDPNKDY